jgi:hypothetical protein
MGYNCIRIERERNGFSVSASDPAIVEANNKRNGKGYDGPSEWKDPNVEFQFDTKAQVLAFLEKAMDIALPADEYSSAFDKLAKEALKA